MQFDKVSLFYVAPDATIRVRTTVTANGQSCEIDGLPMIEVTNEVVQLGGIRITRGALYILQNMAQTMEGLLQRGDYKTADPNTRKDKQRVSYRQPRVLSGACDSPWTMENIGPESSKQTELTNRYKLWSRIEDNRWVYNILRNGITPKETDGGYYSIQGALRAKGL